MINFVQHVFAHLDYRERAEAQRERIRAAMAGSGFPYRLISSQALNEHDTLSLMHYLSWHDETPLWCYVHLKGLTHPENQNVQDWREVLEYFTIDRWKDARRELEQGIDAVGVGLSSDPATHFSGNFFWATGRALRKLKSPATVAPEAWIGTAALRLKSLHDSGVNHYQEPYPPERYR